MAVSLYMDHHVPKAITTGLRLRGVDVLTSYEDGTDQLDDNLLLQRAYDLKRALFTQDQYFTKARNWRSLTPNLRQRAQTTRGFRDLLRMMICWRKRRNASVREKRFQG